MRHQPEMTDRSRSGRAIFFAPVQTPPERSAFAYEKQHFYDICKNSALSQMYVSNVQYVPEKEDRRLSLPTAESATDVSELSLLQVVSLRHSPIYGRSLFTDF